MRLGASMNQWPVLKSRNIGIVLSRISTPCPLYSIRFYIELERAGVPNIIRIAQLLCQTFPFEYSREDIIT